MQALLSFEHEQHRTITDHDIIIFTDFAAKVKYENFSSSTCEHPNQGTLCIAVVLHSPGERPVQKATTVTEQLPTGLESMPVSDERKAPQTVKQGKRETEQVMERTLLCDVFCAYSDESGNARFNHTLLRDLIAYYKLGHLVHATAATHRGEPLPIGKDAASAKPSEYDRARLERLARTRAAQERQKAAEAVEREQSAAVATAEPLPAPAATPASGGKKPLQKRKGAGEKRKAPALATEGDTPAAAVVVDTDRRGKLQKMRQQLTWSDGCGVQYVQREAALGTASMYGDIEVLAQQATDPAAKFGVFGRHVVFEPHCFKYRPHAYARVVPRLVRAKRPQNVRS